MNRPVDTAEVRQSNLALVLRTLDRLTPCARIDLRRATGLVSGTVSSIIDELIARGVVVETGETTSGGRGRPRRVLSLRPERVVSIIVQLTREEVVGELRDLAGRPRWERRVRHTIRRGIGADVVNELGSMVREANDAALRLPTAWVCGVIIAVPAPVVSGRDIAHAIDFGLERTELAEPLRHMLGGDHELVIMNDGRLGALAEYAALPEADRPTAMVYVRGGAGVGGGIVLNGSPYLGSHLMAGECGHISVAMDGPECECGARGCLNLYLGTDRLFAAAGISAPVDTPGELSLEVLQARLRAGESTAVEAVNRAGAALASAIGTMTNYTDIDLVVLGGTLTTLQRWLLPPVQQLIDVRRTKIAEFNPAVRLATYGEEAARVGAWKLAREAVLANPAQVPLVVDHTTALTTSELATAG